METISLVMNHQLSFLTMILMIITMIGLISLTFSHFPADVLHICHPQRISIPRHDSGRVMIEGCVSEDYYLIRDLLYQQYAIV